MCSVSYVYNNVWGNGFVASITITNIGSEPITDGWVLTFDVVEGSMIIVNGWNGQFSQSGSSVTVINAGWNPTIPPNGGSVSVGFQGSYEGTLPVLTNFAINGVPCN